MTNTHRPSICIPNQKHRKTQEETHTLKKGNTKQQKRNTQNTLILCVLHTSQKTYKKQKGNRQCSKGNKYKEYNKRKNRIYFLKICSIFATFPTYIVDMPQPVQWHQLRREKNVVKYYIYKSISFRFELFIERHSSNQQKNLTFFFYSEELCLNCTHHFNHLKFLML